MTASTGKTGRGVTLELSDGASPAVYVALANVKSIGFGGRDAEEVDFTHLGSSGGFRELRQGYKDPGSITFELHADPTNPTHQSLVSLFLSGAQIDFRINYTGAGWNVCEYGEGFIKNPGDVTINPTDPVGGSGTLRVSGPTNFAPA